MAGFTLNPLIFSETITLSMKNSLLEDPEAQTTKDAIEFFTRLGNRYNISHVAQVKLPLTPNLKVKLVNGASSSDIRSIKVFYPSPKVDDMDDESYGDFSGDLPHC